MCVYWWFSKIGWHTYLDNGEGYIVDFFTAWSMLFHPEMLFFTNCSRYNTWIMVLPKLSFILHYCTEVTVGGLYVMAEEWNLLTALLAEVLVMLFLLGMLLNVLKWALSVIISQIKNSHCSVGLSGFWVIVETALQWYFLALPAS